VTEELDQVELQRAVKDVMWLFDRIKDFEARATRANRGRLAEADARAVAEALALLAQLLTPFAPHVGEEIWSASGRGDSSGDVTWPAGRSPALSA
jgi:leucyl-tRNA synthetase